MRIVQNSPAKLNLFLEIQNRRSDGYHELQTVMLRTTWHDRLEFHNRSDQQITVCLHKDSSPTAEVGFPVDGSNLIIKAARELQAATGTKHGVDVVVTKNIPAEAGLAGGSSNAATTLLALNRLWQCEAADFVLHKIAAELGSDINFFLPNCAAAVCSGRGENVRPIPMVNQLFAVAMRAPVGNPTGTVFQGTQISDTPANPEQLIAAMADQKRCRSQVIGELACNRLTHAAQYMNPGMHQMMQAMESICQRKVLMSGSGSTCFVLFDSMQAATLADQRLKAKANPDWLTLGVLELENDA